MTAETTSPHQEWLAALDQNVRAAVEAEMLLHKPDGVWEFEALEPENDWVPGSRVGLTVHFNGEEMTDLTKAFGASTVMFEIMHDALMERARAVLEERGESPPETVAAAD